ncbi:MAG: hypothetical protein V1793_10300 [Pseudomonadota bacterium]
MNDEVFIAPKCSHQDCGQEFNEDNFRLAVYLYGIFFLVGPDKGFVGFTCPRCLRTTMVGHSRNDILQLKRHLAHQQIEIFKQGLNKEGMLTLTPVLTFPADLQYYSPFMLQDEIKREYGIVSYGASGIGGYENLSDQLINYSSYEIPELNDRYCSYINDDTKPSGMFTCVCWYEESQLSKLLDLENKDKIRIFPRYYFSTELIENIDALTRFEYVVGQQTDQYKIALQESDANVREQLRKDAYDKNQNYDRLLDDAELDDLEGILSKIDETQNRVSKNPLEASSEFLQILLVDPLPLGNELQKGYCEYLWNVIDPFHNRTFPETFVNEVEFDDEIASAMREEHDKRVARITQNATKGYVQEFLQSNLDDFLEEYEETLRSNDFSYARVWQLKESYLDGLYAKNQTELRSEAPYAMYREGKSWKMVFEGKPFGGLMGRGFLWIYLTMFHHPKPVYYTSLNDNYTSDSKRDSSSGTNEAVRANQGEEDRRRGHIDFEQEAYKKKTVDHMKKENQLRITRSGVLTKQYYADQDTLDNYQKILEDKELALERAKLEGDFERFEEVMEDLQEFEVSLKKIGIFKVEVEPGRGEYKLISSKFKDDKYLKINSRIKKNYRDALSVLDKMKDAKPLYAHLSKYFRSEDGAFVYEPPEGIDWHLN